MSPRPVAACFQIDAVAGPSGSEEEQPSAMGLAMRAWDCLGSPAVPYTVRYNLSATTPESMGRERIMGLLGLMLRVGV
jgi:hypothetical protein